MKNQDITVFQIVISLMFMLMVGGIKAPAGEPLEYLIAGYHVGSGTPITLKSYLGTL